MTEQDKTRHQPEDLLKELENLKKQFKTMKLTKDVYSKRKMKKIKNRIREKEKYIKRTEKIEALKKKTLDDLAPGKSKTNLITEQDKIRLHIEGLQKDCERSKHEIENLKKQIQRQDEDCKQLRKEIEKRETYFKLTKEKIALKKTRIEELQTCIKTQKEADTGDTSDGTFSGNISGTSDGTLSGNTSDDDTSDDTGDTSDGKVKQKGPMPEDDYKTIRANYSYLVNHIKEPGKLSRKLYEKGVFDSEENRKIQKIYRTSEYGCWEAADKLLMYVLSNCGDVYGKFIQCLRELGYKKIISVLENTLEVCFHFK
ncbi:uncharacterized protein LOC130010518 [Patella vulgata]|uniref:uncharacterized protein LOC130010518 n=1 Tax=Patella vulgata TaxID=6465 RepID=UPI0024A883CF|nr:uncharacterized protein LOC130010518 [Patella vulgata]